MFWLFPGLMRYAIVFGLAVVFVAMIAGPERACQPSPVVRLP